MLSLPLFATEIPFDIADEFPPPAYNLISEQRVVWLGELHGTNEAPELLLGLIKLVATHSPSPPIVGLEIPSSDQAAIDSFLQSGDEALLKSSVFFTRKSHDGRSSRAIVKLLSALRSQRITGVICYDAVGVKSAQERDTMMAANLYSIAQQYPLAKLIVLSGNIHSQIIQGTRWDPSYRPAAFELKQMLPSLVSFKIEFESGTAWLRMQNGFGQHELKGLGWDGERNHYITVHPEPLRGHNGTIFTRKLTGSPPWIRDQ